MTNGIAAVTFVAFCALFAAGLVDQAAVLGGFIPARIGDAALFDGVSAVPALLTPISCTLVHVGWLHLGFNLLMLLFCGRQVEYVLGRAPMLVLYLVGAYGAAAASWAVDPASTTPGVGASGAISAIIGTYALLYSRQEVKRIGPFSANVVRVAWLAAGWIAFQLMIGVATTGGFNGGQPIGIAAHIGGFLVGLALTRPLLRWRFRGGPQIVR